MASHPFTPSDTPSRPQSAFQWPIPPPIAPYDQRNSMDIALREILDKYQDNPELLKVILTAKSEEDKRYAVQDTLKVEYARIQQKQMDLEALRSNYGDGPSGSLAYPSGLAPLQQQAIARITGNESHEHTRPYSSHHGYAQYTPRPVSPVGYYPHSAHPLCPPEQPYSTPTSSSPLSSNAAMHSSTALRGYPQTFAYRKSTESDNKRPHSALENDRISHGKVMEALKAKLQRDGQNKRVHTLPKPATAEPVDRTFGQTASPKSAKPVLPPIDTSIGCIRGPLSSDISPLDGLSSHRLPPISATVSGANGRSALSPHISRADHSPSADGLVKLPSPPRSRDTHHTSDTEPAKESAPEP